MRDTPASPPLASSSRKHKMRKFTREQLLKSLEILGPLTNPLPPDLPPSPPASRESSPAPGAKRKLDGAAEESNRKKPRTSTVADDSHSRPPLPPSPPPPPLSSSSSSSRQSASAYRASDPPEPTTEITTVSRPIGTVTPYVPVRRPRRGRLHPPHFEELHDKYHAYGRILKYSGEKRLWSTYPQGHPDHRALLDPPNPTSPYHKYGHLIARLELVDSLVCFAYAIWNKDYSYKRCTRLTWASIEAFLCFCKREWALEDTDDREKAFLGLVWLIEAFIHARKFAYAARGIDHENGRIMKYLRAKADAEIMKEQKEAEAAAAQGTPRMLPSPESTTASSANSTPTARPGDTPNSGGGNSTISVQSSTQPQRPLPQQQLRSAESIPPPHITASVNSQWVAQRRSQSGGLLAAAYCLDQAQKLLTLPIMSKHYPRTFGRMVYSSLSVTDEHEPDFEDEEGELFWPGQCVTGEGLGWVCIMGKAMLKEFSKEYGYKGLDAVIPKPIVPNEPPENTDIVPQPSPRPSSEQANKR